MGAKLFFAGIWGAFAAFLQSIDNVGYEKKNGRYELKVTGKTAGPLLVEGSNIVPSKMC